MTMEGVTRTDDAIVLDRRLDADAGLVTPLRAIVFADRPGDLGPVLALGQPAIGLPAMVVQPCAMGMFDKDDVIEWCRRTIDLLEGR